MERNRFIPRLGKDLFESDKETVALKVWDTPTGGVYLIRHGKGKAAAYCVARWDRNRNQWSSPAYGNPDGGTWVGPLSYVAHWESESGARRRFKRWTAEA